MRTEIVGRDEIVGADALNKFTRVVKKVAGLPIDAFEYLLRQAPMPSKSWFIGSRTEIVGDDEISADELEMAREGGPAERRAAARRLSSSGFNGKWQYMRPGTSVMGLSHRQRRLVRRLAQNPTLLAKIQQRANQGDQRALRLMAAYRARTAQTTVPYGATSPYGSAAPYASPWGTPATTQPIPAPSTNVYYPAAPSYTEPQEYDDYSGADEKVSALAALIKPALKSRRISRVELARAAAVSAGQGATNNAINTARERIVSFLARQGVTVE